MSKFSNSLTKSRNPFDQPKNKKNAAPGSMAGALGLLLSILAFAVLPLLKTLELGSVVTDLGVPLYVLPIALAVLAVVCGFKGRGGVAAIGLLLGIACLLLASVCVGIDRFAPQFNTTLKPVYELSGLEMPTAVSPVTGSPVPNIEQKSSPNPDSAADALIFTQNLVASKLSEGLELNQITEALMLNETQYKYWQSISILQGTITAIPVGSDQALAMLPLQEGNKITWACSGNIPESVKELCE